MKNKKFPAKRAGCAWFCFVGSAFFFCSVTGRELKDRGDILWTGSHTAYILGVSLALGLLSGGLLCLLVCKADKLGGALARLWRGVSPAKRREGKARAFFVEPGGDLPPEAAPQLRISYRAFFREPGGSPPVRKWFWGSWSLIFLSWLPAFLAYYPAICAYDISVQLGQIMSSGFYSSHHPLLHTLLVEAFWRFGKIIRSATFGIALFALAQMAVLSGMFAMAVSTAMAVRRGGRRGLSWYCVALVGYGILFPFHKYLSVSMTKDTLFSAFVLLMMMALCRSLAQGRDSLRWNRWDGLYAAAALMTVVLRNNGPYALAVLLAALALALLFSRKDKKLWGRLLIGTGVGFAAGCLLLFALFRITQAAPGDSREMLSLPIQQLSRVMLMHGGVGALARDDGSMGEKEKALIHDFILDEGYLLYRPALSDPVKGHVNTYVPRYRPKDFLEVYLGLFLRYPGDYLNAALALNAGYLYPQDVSHASVYGEDDAEGLRYIQTRWQSGGTEPMDIYRHTRWPWLRDRLEDYANENAYLKHPVLKYLLVPGTYLWLYLVFFGCLLVWGRYRFLLPFAFIGGYYGTLFLGPCVQLRYLYPVMICLPFLCAAVWGHTRSAVCEAGQVPG
ncbi:MAG: DUF6020 family protein [Clostridium sp.]|jgi:hypothetical protein|nr:DUF6020 family protein [Clostridium sp.]